MSCSASENKKWKIIRRKCVDCPSCRLGKARNFSEHYVGPSVLEGDTQCLPCRECPRGSFAGENECQPCNIFCDTDYKREFDEICEESHDAECGSCLFGYEDIYRNTKLPCSLKQEHVTAHAPISNNQEQSVWNETEINNIGQTVNSLSEYSADVDLNVQSSNEVNLDGTNLSVFRTPAIIVCTLVAISITIVWLVWFRRKRRQQRTENIEASEDDTDIQTDGGDSQYSSQTEVGGELRLGGTVPLLHSKLSYPSKRVGTHPLGVCINGSTVYELVLSRERTSMPCGCRDHPDCQCYISDLPEKEIQKNDKYILTVSTSMCHSPDNLFNALSLDYTVIYPIQNDRELDPIGTTFQDKNLRVLNRWVEIQSTPVTLHTLMKALCESGFHKINQKLKDIYSINSPLLESDNGGRR